MAAIALNPPQNSTSTLIELDEDELKTELAQLLPTGSIFPSPGNSFQYEVISPICRLYDLDELPYRCCRLQWRGKEPSWNRQGRRFVPDLATRKHGSYWVKLIGGENCLTTAEMEITPYWKPAFSIQMLRWWTRNRERVSHSTARGMWIIKVGLDEQPIEVWKPRESGQLR